ncbi:YHS domain-containing (seleno)protein [Ruegeria marisrubri]|uniref:YHS domain-containing (seleno)protein n=1 Tax=Ruegeria marisrubri TaxID=1685379 RepID=UPI001F0B4703
MASLTAILIAPAADADSPVFYSADGAAVSGYDAVAYFMTGQPVMGDPDISVMWKGVVWRFVSQKNREAFEANPRAFAPQFGGYCAYAVGKGYLMSADPTAWRIVDGKLYLTHSAEVADMWQEDIPGNIVLAEQHWPQVLRQ